MRILKYLIRSLFLGYVSLACIHDDSTDYQTPGSPITISVQDTNVYIDFGDTLHLSAEVTQLDSSLPLKYEWKALMDDSLKHISSDAELSYRFPASGTYILRLRVENKYTSSFKYYSVKVQDPFEQGILILSNDPQTQKGRMSFVRIKTEMDILEAKSDMFNIDAFTMANPDMPLNGVRDAVKVYGNKLYVSSSLDRCIYSINYKNFLVENIIDTKGFTPWLYPTIITGSDLSIQTEVTLCSDNGDFAFMKVENGLVYEDGTCFRGDNKYTKVLFRVINDKVREYNKTFYIDQEKSEVHCLENNKYAYSAENYFKEMDIIDGVFISDNQALFVTRMKNDPDSVTVFKNTNFNEIIGFEKFYGYRLEPNMDISLKPTMSLHHNSLHNVCFYYEGNKLYRWVLNASNPIFPSKPAKLLNDPNDVITCMNFSKNMKYIYLCVYNEMVQGELKGKLVILNADTLIEENTIKGISDKAVKVFWKRLDWNEP